MSKRAAAKAVGGRQMKVVDATPQTIAKYLAPVAPAAMGGVAPQRDALDKFAPFAPSAPKGGGGSRPVSRGNSIFNDASGAKGRPKSGRRVTADAVFPDAPPSGPPSRPASSIFSSGASGAAARHVVGADSVWPDGPAAPPAQPPAQPPASQPLAGRRAPSTGGMGGSAGGMGGMGDLGMGGLGLGGVGSNPAAVGRRGVASSSWPDAVPPPHVPAAPAAGVKGGAIGRMQQPPVGPSASAYPPLSFSSAFTSHAQASAVAPAYSAAARWTPPTGNGLPGRGAQPPPSLFRLG